MSVIDGAMQSDGTAGAFAFFGAAISDQYDVLDRQIPAVLPRRGDQEAISIHTGGYRSLGAGHQPLIVSPVHHATHHVA